LPGGKGPARGVPGVGGTMSLKSPVLSLESKPSGTTPRTLGALRYALCPGVVLDARVRGMGRPKIQKA